jgi:hypothetical protein
MKGNQCRVSSPGCNRGARMNGERQVWRGRDGRGRPWTFRNLGTAVIRAGPDGFLHPRGAKMKTASQLVVLVLATFNVSAQTSAGLDIQMYAGLTVTGAVDAVCWRNYGVDTNRPVEMVDWVDATNYCDQLTQQERAAAAGTSLPGTAGRHFAAAAARTSVTSVSTSGWCSPQVNPERDVLFGGGVLRHKGGGWG